MELFIASRALYKRRYTMFIFLYTYTLSRRTLLEIIWMWFVAWWSSSTFWTQNSRCIDHNRWIVGKDQVHGPHVPLQFIPEVPPKTNALYSIYPNAETLHRRDFNACETFRHDMGDLKEKSWYVCRSIKQSNICYEFLSCWHLKNFSMLFH